MDRLLSREFLLTDDEMVDILDHAHKPCPMEFKDEPKIRAISFWQNLKSVSARDKEWVEWGEDKCPHIEHPYDEYFKRECSKCWQERKKEIWI